MPRLPGPETVGGLPSLRSGRSAPNVGSLDTGASAVAASVAKAGGALAANAEEARKEDDALDLAKADAHLTQGLTQLHREFETDPDFYTFGPRFSEGAAKIKSDAEGMIRNPSIREKWQPRADTHITTTLDRTLAHGDKLAREAKFDELDGVLSTQRNTYDAAPDDATRDSVAKSMDDTVELGTRSGLLTPERARMLRKQHITGQGGALYREAEGRLWDDPFGVLSDLNAAGRQRPNAETPSGDLTLDFIRAKEGFTPKAQWDFKQYSSGYGTKAVAGETITKEEAEKRLRTEVGKVDEWIGDNITVPLNPKQRTALSSFGFNLGTGKGGLEDLKDDINAGNVDRVARRMLSFNRSGGEVNPGLVSRRREESALFRAGATEGIATPPPETPVAEEGDRVPAIGGEAPSPSAMRYARMDPQARHALITRARVALSDTMQRDLRDASAEAARTGQIPTDEQGRTALDRAARILSPNQLAKARRGVDEAILGFKASAPLSNMTEEQAVAHLDGLAPSGDAAANAGYAAAAKASDKAWKDWQKIRDLRSADPVRAVSGGQIKGAAGPSLSVGEDGNVVVRQGDETDLRLQPAPEVAKALDLIRQANESQRTPAGVNGKLFTTLRTDPLKAQEMLIEARLEAQNRLGVVQPRVISREEADKLLAMPKTLFKDQDSREYSAALRKAADRFYDTYGPKYAQRAYADAIAFHLSKTDEVNQATAVMSRLIAAQAMREKTGAEFTAADAREARQGLDRVRNLEEIDRIGRAFQGQGQFMPNALQSDGRPAISVPREDLAGITDYASTEVQGQTRREGASKEDLDRDFAWAAHKPDERQTRFDRQYGRGAFAAELAKRKGARP